MLSSSTACTEYVDVLVWSGQFIKSQYSKRAVSSCIQLFHIHKYTCVYMFVCVCVYPFLD